MPLKCENKITALARQDTRIIELLENRLEECPDQAEGKHHLARRLEKQASLTFWQESFDSLKKSIVIGGVFYLVLLICQAQSFSALQGLMFVAAFFVLVSSCKNTSVYLKREKEATLKSKKGIRSRLCGFMVLFFGVFIPFLIGLVYSACHYSPSISFLQSLAFFAVPLSVYLAWREFNGANQSFPLLTRVLAGLSLLEQVVCLLLNSISFLGSRDSGLLFMMGVECIFLVFSVLLFLKLCRTESTTISCRRILPKALGLVGALFLLPGLPHFLTDLRVLFINSDQEILREPALSDFFLKEFDLDLKEKLSEAEKTPPLRIPLARTLYESAYYFLHGESYQAGLPLGTIDPLYASPAVGSYKDPFLKMTASDIVAELSSKSLTAKLDWSLELQSSNGGVGKEARMILRLPEGSALTGLELFSLAPGLRSTRLNTLSFAAAPAKFGNPLHLMQQYAKEALALRDPVLLKAIAPNRVMLQCAPVLYDKPVKVRLRIVAPFRPAISAELARLDLPFVESHNLADSLSTNVTVLTDAHVSTHDGKGLGSGESFKMDLESKQEALQIPIRNSLSKDFLVRGKFAEDTVISRIVSDDGISSLNKRFVLAIDGSAQNRLAKDDICRFLAASAFKRCDKVLFADPIKGLIETNPESAAALLAQSKFRGGDKNIALLEKAIIIARRKKDDVLWLHANKPWFVAESWVKEIGYADKHVKDISLLCGDEVKIFDFPTMPGDNAVLESIIASGGDLKPFVSVARKGSCCKDLERLFRCGREPESDLGLKFILKKEKRDLRRLCENQEGPPELIQLAQQQQLAEMIRRGERSAAERFAADKNMLSIYSAALCTSAEAKVIRLSSDESEKVRNRLYRTMQATETEPLYLSANTVRVNNLANLEALLNIIANETEILGLAWGLPMMVIGLLNCANRPGLNRFLTGASLATLGLATPGVINWLVASGRDSGGFS